MTGKKFGGPRTTKKTHKWSANLKRWEPLLYTMFSIFLIYAEISAVLSFYMNILKNANKKH